MLSDIEGSPLSNWCLLKASLSRSRGGLGMRSTVSLAPAGYVSSVLKSQSLVTEVIQSDPLPANFSDCIIALAEAADHPDWVSMEAIDVPIYQRPLTHCIVEFTFSRVISSAPDPRFSALVLYTALPHAGDWLSVIPSSTLGLHLSGDEYRPCLQYWLGLPIYEEESVCPVCQHPADSWADHQVSCG